MMRNGSGSRGWTPKNAAVETAMGHGLGGNLPTIAVQPR